MRGGGTTGFLNGRISQPDKMGSGRLAVSSRRIGNLTEPGIAGQDQ